MKQHNAPRWPTLRIAALPLMLSAITAHAQTPTPTPALPADHALAPVFVTAPIDEDAIGSLTLSPAALSRHRTASSDTARLLEASPAFSSNSAGGISSLPALRGQANDRLRISVDGMDLMYACPNHMNPVLSYIDPSRVEEITLFAGITPVSEGGDSTAGTVLVKTVAPRFATEEDTLLVEAQAGAYRRSNGNAQGTHYAVRLAGTRLGAHYSESKSSAENYQAAGTFKLPGFWQIMGEHPVPEREVAASEYRGARNRDAGLFLLVSDGHVLQLDVGEQRVGYEGFPNQRMDMLYSQPDPNEPGNYVIDKSKPSNLNRSANLRYNGRFEWGKIEGNLFRQELEHHMEINQDRFYGMYMPMKSDAATLGGAIKTSVPLFDSHTLMFGADFQNYRLNDWWPPIGLFPGSMCCGDFWNIRDGERKRSAVFLQWEAAWSPEWTTQLGIRSGTVTADAGKVQGYSYGSYANDAARFNSREQRRTDHHLDLTALTRFSPGNGQTYEIGLARKTRSPSLYELYPWSVFPMAALMNNFVGDGNGYIGNPDLKPEIAHTLGLSASFADDQTDSWRLKLAGHISYIENYIDAQRCPAALSAQCTTQNLTASNRYVLLQYVNQDALIYGVELSGAVTLLRDTPVGRFDLESSAAYLRGKNRETGDDLHHIMPLNGKLALIQRWAGWSNTVEIVSVAKKDRVSKVRNEVTTDAYTLLNLRTRYDWKHGSVDVSVENVSNKHYSPPLGGAYLGQGNSMTTGGIPWGMTVPGKARSVNIAVNLRY